MRNIDTEELFYKYLNGDITTSKFEKYVYEIDEENSIINSEDFFELISINYQSKFAFEEIQKIIEKYVDYAKFEKIRLLDLLEKAKTLDKISGDIFIKFYDMYCDGYYFLQDLGLGYGLSCQVPRQSRNVNDDWDSLNDQQKIELLSDFYPKVISDIQRVQEWILSEKIIVLGKGDDDRLLFFDYRTDEEKISSIIMASKDHKVKKKWWEFWKEKE